MSYDDGGEIYGPKTLCICPRCNRKHTIKMRWIGRGTPKKFCPPCKLAVDCYDSQGESSLNIYAAIQHTRMVEISR